MRRSNKCKCVDALHSKHHKKGCKNNAIAFIVLRRVPSTHKKPIPMCLKCARFAVLLCDAFAVERYTVHLS